MTLTIEKCRQQIREAYLADESQVVSDLLASFSLEKSDRKLISSNAADLVRRVRTESTPSMMEKFLAEYGLTTTEGVALMCLAEALLRVPDSTLDSYAGLRDAYPRTSFNAIHPLSDSLTAYGRLELPRDLPYKAAKDPYDQEEDIRVGKVGIRSPLSLMPAAARQLSLLKSNIGAMDATSIWLGSA